MLLLLLAPLLGAAVHPVPVPAQEVPYVGVLDGERIQVRLHPQADPTIVRLRGLAAPPLQITCSDPSEQARLRAVARGLVDSLNELLRRAHTVTLEHTLPDGEGGLVATVVVSGSDLGALLVRLNLAQPHEEGDPPPHWCD